ncbi:DUF952 domain-containing protein [Acuticoccus kandeliae]|uniref:DUF952 domain-containing protein n=1 Tax=Acuticoccus kandeliae TaxID=2073160 RepID=UPI000D3E4678|nr:DUF952 domain-containing protein [Acuticoccus kandeliae]
MTDHEHTYKILTAEELARMVVDRSFAGSADDLRDGFVHLSTSAQIPGTILRHFRENTSIFAVQCSVETMAADLKWEASRGGQLFPHLYRPLSLSDVTLIVPIPDEREGWALPTLPSS